jgi:hypothetical protein
MAPSPSRVNLLGMLINEEDETTFLQTLNTNQPTTQNHSSQDLNPHPAYSSLSVASQVSTGKTAI